MQKIANISTFEALSNQDFSTVSNAVNLAKPAGQGINLQKDPTNSVNYQQGVSIIADGIGKLIQIGVSVQDVLAIIRKLMPRANMLAQRVKQRSSYFTSYKNNPGLSGFSR